MKTAEQIVQEAKLNHLIKKENTMNGYEHHHSLENCYYLMHELDKLMTQDMYKLKNQALKKLSSVVAYSNLEEMAQILAYSYFDNIDPAKKLAHQLDLGKLDFIALQEDLEAFKAEYLKDYQPAQKL
jgi:hypothetical protein